MQPVGDTWFANGSHEDIAESHKNECRSCHGPTGEGTVLSAMAVTRTLQCDDEDEDDDDEAESISTATVCRTALRQYLPKVIR